MATPGPWMYRPVVLDQEYTVERIDEDLRSKIAVCRDFNLCPEHGGTIEGNARLIAAAPEMAEALADLVSLLEFLPEEYVSKSDGPLTYSPDGALAKARAILARLHGEGETK